MSEPIRRPSLASDAPYQGRSGITAGLSKYVIQIENENAALRSENERLKAELAERKENRKSK